jgi:DNA-binding MarR family transcriptional regulator
MTRTGTTAPLSDPASGADIVELTGRLHVALARLVRLLRREAPTALGASALSTLATLAAEGPLRPGDLAAREGVRPPTMTRIVAALEQDGHITRALDPADRRACLVQVSQAGAALVAGTRFARASQLARHLARLTPAQRDAIAAALPALQALSTGTPFGAPDQPSGPVGGSGPARQAPG